MTSSFLSVPEPGELVRVRGEHWIVAKVDQSHQPIDELASARLPGRTIVTLMNVSGEDVGEELRLVWEIEPGHRIESAEDLPVVTETGWDASQQMGAFLDAVRWGTVASADARTLQAPFRSGITVQEHQLAPVAKALAMPRVNLLIADDVGLGKTIETGLVIQEMLLRHRARRVMVVCPATLTGKWRDEMTEKFGLDFTILDSAVLRELRRTHGLAANPFSVFPRTIISLQWLRSPRVRRLLDEVLAAENRYPGYFDLLVVDEVHHCAPSAPRRGKGYAVDSKQTEVVRLVGEHSQHRMFLSATPHNGYSNSWQAPLAMLDPQRFTRGVEPDESVLDEVMVRRLKDWILDENDEPRFKPRTPRAIEVTYTPTERQAHDLLKRYKDAQMSQTATAVRANDLVTLLLKKRLFSSPAAFNHTLQAHANAVRATGLDYRVSDDSPEWMNDASDWDDETPDDAPGSASEQEYLFQLGSVSEPLTDDAQELLDQMLAWASGNAESSDSKANALVQELNRVLDADDLARVIVFTEYRDTQEWLAQLLDSRGLGGDRLGLLYGGMEPQKRDRVKVAFQAAPHRHPLRILLATDSASEGIDLQNHCHRVIHYDIPFNPNRLEQRIGRVDRFGQRFPVDVVHFVGADWQRAEAGSHDGDLEFLSRIATKIATERRDLGSVNPVLAVAVEARMLGRPVLVDPLAVDPKPATIFLNAERDLREQTRRLREQLHRSEQRLHVAPANVRRVVDAALVLAAQPSLIDAGDGLVTAPELRNGWERTLVGLQDPLSLEPRLLTFDSHLAQGRDDVVYAHLEHALVAQSSRLLRSAMWGGHTGYAPCLRSAVPGSRR